MLYNVSMANTYDFNNFIKWYNNSPSIHKMNPLKNQTYKVLKSSNLDIRIVSRDTMFKYLKEADRVKINHITVDVGKKSHRYLYAIPVQAPNGIIVGFIYRTVFDKAYASIYRPFADNSKKVPYMFGFYKDFQNFDRHTSCMPILVCEGAKDAIILKKIYPYTLACNTSSMGISAHILANVTDKFLLAYDNDPTGEQQTKKDKRLLFELGCSVDVVNYADGFKDAGDYIGHPQEYSSLREQIKNKLRGLIYGVTLSV